MTSIFCPSPQYSQLEFKLGYFSCCALIANCVTWAHHSRFPAKFIPYRCSQWRSYLRLKPIKMSASSINAWTASIFSWVTGSSYSHLRATDAPSPCLYTNAQHLLHRENGLPNKWVVFSVSNVSVFSGCYFCWAGHTTPGFARCIQPSVWRNSCFSKSGCAFLGRNIIQLLSWFQIWVQAQAPFEQTCEMSSTISMDFNSHAPRALNQRKPLSSGGLTVAQLASRLRLSTNPIVFITFWNVVESFVIRFP